MRDRVDAFQGKTEKLSALFYIVHFLMDSERFLYIRNFALRVYQIGKIQ